MRITREQLQGLVDEEVSAALSKIENRTLLEAFAHGEMSALRSMSATSLIRFARAYAALGPQAQETLDALLVDTTSVSSPGAVHDIEEKLGRYNDEIAAAVAEWKSENDY
jgi:hypothetical protein